jgi:hypothetical protein
LPFFSGGTASPSPSPNPDTASAHISPLSSLPSKSSKQGKKGNQGILPQFSDLQLEDFNLGSASAQALSRARQIRGQQ